MGPKKTFSVWVCSKFTLNQYMARIISRSLLRVTCRSQQHIGNTTGRCNVGKPFELRLESLYRKICSRCQPNSTWCTAARRHHTRGVSCVSRNPPLSCGNGWGGMGDRRQILRALTVHGWLFNVAICPLRFAGYFWVRKKLYLYGFVANSHFDAEGNREQPVVLVRHSYHDHLM